MGQDSIPNNQIKSVNVITQREHEDAAAAKRALLVDRDGNPIDESHPLFVKLSDGSISIGTVNAEIETQLSHKDNVPDVGDVADSVRIGDGINELEIESDGSINANITGAVSVSGVSTEAKQDVQITSLGNIESKLDSVNTNLGLINSEISTSNSLLQQIEDNTDQVENKLDDVIQAIQDQEPIKISGTENGLVGGTEYLFTNNRKQQILSSKDKEQYISYADFGTKNERITQIDYQSPTFPGITARKVISYSLVGSRYRRDSIIWSIV